jgi:hypothetical protein
MNKLQYLALALIVASGSVPALAPALAQEAKADDVVI